MASDSSPNLRSAALCLCLGVVGACSAPTPEQGTGDRSTKVTTAALVESQSPPLLSQLGSDAGNKREWRERMRRTPRSKKGCFRATYPIASWGEVPCAPPPPPHSAPKHHPVQPGLSTGGGANDYTPITDGTLWRVIGSFPTVSGVTSEQDCPPGTVCNNGVHDAYELQVNSNAFNTSLCAGHTGCVGWEQFLYSSYNSQGIFIEYWLNGWGASMCPSGFRPDGSGNCVMDTPVTTVGTVPITSLSDLVLHAAVSDAGDDVLLETSDDFFLADGPELGLSADEWNAVEFTVVGDMNGTNAVFNSSGATIGLKMELFGSSSAAPLCGIGSVNTGETNNLNVISGSCCPAAGNPQTLTFLESNASGVTVPFCFSNDLAAIVALLY